MTILEALVSAGTSVFVCNRFGVTPLHVAARENRRELVRRLVDLGADVEAIDEVCLLFEEKKEIEIEV